MRRLVISLSLLALLAGAGVWNTALLRETCGSVTGLLQAAQDAGECGDWAEAEALTHSAWAHWDGRSTYLYVVLRHDYTDEVYTGFRELLELIEWGETPEYAAASSRLITLLEHMNEGERLTWENLL